MHPREPLDLLCESRLCRARRPAQRPLQGRAQVHQRRLRLDGAALARVTGQVAVAVKRHRDAEQALDHALVDLACQIDPLLELARGLRLGCDDPRDRRQRRRLSQRPQQVPVGVAELGRGHQAIGEHHSDRPSGGGHRRAHKAHRLREQTRVLGGELAADVAGDLDHAVLAQCARRDRRRLDGHVGLGKLLEVQSVSARRTDPPTGRVIAEDDRPAHPCEMAYRLAQAVVDGVAAGSRPLPLRQHSHEQLEGLDSDGAATRFGGSLHRRYRDVRRG